MKILIKILYLDSNCCDLFTHLSCSTNLYDNIAVVIFQEYQNIIKRLEFDGHAATQRRITFVSLGAAIGSHMSLRLFRPSVIDCRNVVKIVVFYN